MARKAIELKKEQVAELSKRMQEANSVVLLDYLGLSVDEVTELRAKLREEGCVMQVMKNNIIKRAAQDAGFKDMGEFATGPNAVAFSMEDSVSAAKVIYEYAKDHKKLELKVGVVDGEFMDNDKIQTIATIPSRDELLTMFAGGLLEPIKDVAVALQLHAENLETDNG